MLPPSSLPIFESTTESMVFTQLVLLPVIDGVWAFYSLHEILTYLTGPANSAAR